MIDETGPLDVRYLEAAARQLGPWTSDALVRVTVMNAIGVIFVAASWFEMSAQTTVTDQLSWLNVGLVGVGVCGAANALWLLRGRRSIGLARRVIWPARPGRAHDSGAGDGSTAEVRWSDGTHRYHRPGCALLADRSHRAISRSAATARDLVPCEVCEP